MRNTGGGILKCREEPDGKVMGHLQESLGGGVVWRQEGREGEGGGVGMGLGEEVGRE